MKDFSSPIPLEFKKREKIIQILDDCEQSTIFDVDEEAFRPVREAMDLATNDIEILCRGAEILCRYFPGLLIAEKAYERVLELDFQHALALKSLSWMAASQGNYERAVEFGERLIMIPEEDTPENFFIAARACRLNGSFDRAQVLLRKIVNLIPTDRPSVALRDGSALKPVAAFLGGWEDEAEAAIREICCRDGAGYYLRDIEYYPDAIDLRLDRLRKITAGKDICIYGAGPSVANVAMEKNILSQNNFIHFIINTFSIIEDEILKPAGAKLSLTCFSHPAVLLGNNERLNEFLKRDYPTMALISDFVLYYCVRRPEFAYLHDHVDQLFRYRATNKLPPTPRDPLGFPSLNTLMLALCAAVLGRPRRIFLFGFDQRVEGAAAEKESMVYYKELDERYPAHDRSNLSRRKHISDWVKWDAIQVNEISCVTLRMLALMFRVELPPIYNVCPDSALESFPKIDIKQFLKMV
tara:strand:- start:1476 stop:2879 length:1404 start_codon:yes stop_codon:yes gene_type:complete